MKVSSGLTQGRNMSDSVVERWICTMPGSLHVTEAVEAFAGVTGESSDQHISLSRSWQTRDTIWLNQLSPFSKSEKFNSLSSGIVAYNRVNCDSAEELGKNAVRGIVGISFANVTLKRKLQVFTLAAMGKTITIDKDPVVVNPNQLFHCITCVVRIADDLEDCLQYELAPYPQSLSDDVGLQVGTKSKIIQVIDTMCKISSKLPENPSYVLNGGDLLHRVHWPCPATYGEVYNTYFDYINQNCGRNVIVVFDGYEQSTKDAVHMRRAVGKSAAKVDVTLSNAMTIAQEQFLSNVDNKQSFLKPLTTEFKKVKFAVFQAPSDVDVLVVETAKTEAESGRSAVVVGTNSDLLVLIAALTQPQCAVYMLVPGNSTTARKVYCSRELHKGFGNMMKHLLFLHTFMRCNTTSALYKRASTS
ncbi:hypothetical protein PR048_021593 [Dryococelus australis]|uniref:Uncharacterized protein n=1 Tax=Dryococelus australis TaxID=614101 RepID=A0ABQ9GYL9_9NEOP|nr:hypothetical protein PR048_021593 [Dryococelus australis]